jgi:hypothetical protein
MNKRNHKSKPAPRTSPATDHRRPIIQHGDETSVGTTPGNRRKAILDVRNGESFDGGSSAAPGANGPALTDEGSFGFSSW